MEAMLTEAQWARIAPLLPTRRRNPRGGRPRADDRACLEGILWVLRTGARVLDEVIAHRRDREARILAAWREGVREPRELVAAAYDALAPGLEPVARRQVAAHLEHLAERGEI